MTYHLRVTFTDRPPTGMAGTLPMIAAFLTGLFGSKLYDSHVAVISIDEVNP